MAQGSPSTQQHSAFNTTLTNHYGLSTQKPLAPFLVPSGTIFVPINAYFVPGLICCILVVNVMVCLVLLKPHIRSTTNTILTAMAVADTLTGLCPLPCYLYFYTAGHYREFVSYDWCYSYLCLTDFLPSIFHTASVWLTLVLAFQRYLSVCHAHASRWLCTIRNATITAGCVLLVAVLSQIGRFVEMDYFPVVLKSNLPREPTRVTVAREIESLFFRPTFVDQPGFRGPYASRNPIVDLKGHSFITDIASATIKSQLQMAFHGDSGYSNADVVGCSFAMKRALVPFQHLYFNSYYLFRIFFIHFIPCMSLIVLNGILLKTMREGQTRRTRLLKMNRLSESRRLAEINRTTFMLVIVVALFLVVEVPSAIIFILHVLQNSFGLVTLISYTNAENVTTIVNLIILLSYPMNFFIYCAMSTQFRAGFVQLFRRSPTSSDSTKDKNGRWLEAPAKGRSRSCTENAFVETIENSNKKPGTGNAKGGAKRATVSADGRSAVAVVTTIGQSPRPTSPAT